ncbi:MAG TPA: outer membrane beta-barrel protein [Caulobacteraceae bacterium]|jgi:hypothetical protein|nr:outer membrane beta-barrel protein [Caulobacteraceae bacterium]
MPVRAEDPSSLTTSGPQIAAPAAPTWSDAAVLADAPGLHIATTQQVLYDTNVARGDLGVAQLRGITPAEFIYSPAASIDFVHPFGPETLILKGTAGYDFHSSNRVLSGERLELNSSVKSQLGRCNTVVGAGYSRMPSDLEQLNIAVTHNDISVETASLDADCGRAVGLDTKVALTEQWASNSNPQVRIDNFHSFTAVPAIGYRRPSFGEIELYGSFQEVSYPDRDLMAGPASIQDGYRLLGAGLKFDRRLGARIQATFRIGFVGLRPDISSVPGFNGLTYGADVSARMTGRIRFSFSFQRDAAPATWQDVTYAISDTESMQAEYLIGPRFKLDIGLSRTADDYHGSHLAPGIDLQHDRIDAAFGALSFAMSRRIKFGVELRHENRAADVFGYNYADTQVGFTAAAAL